MSEVTKPAKWSPTLINQTKNCCLRAWECRLQGKPVEVAIPEFEVGKELHEYATEYIRTGDEKYLKNFNQKASDTLKYIRGYSDKVHVELALETDIIKGQIDCAIETPDGWIVIDFKSRYESGIKQEDKVQLLSYLYMLQKNMPIDAKRHRIGIMSLHNTFDPLCIEFAEYDLEYLEDYVSRQIELAEQRLKHMSINTGWCKFCQYIISCDVNDKQTDNINDIAAKYLQMKELIKRYEDILKKHVEATGNNIILNNIEIGMHTKQKTVIDSYMVKQLCSEANIPIEQVFKPDIYAIKKLVKSIPSLENAVSYEIEYTFGARKVNEK